MLPPASTRIIKYKCSMAIVLAVLVVIQALTSPVTSLAVAKFKSSFSSVYIQPYCHQLFWAVSSLASWKIHNSHATMSLNFFHNLWTLYKVTLLPSSSIIIWCISHKEYPALLMTTIHAHFISKHLYALLEANWCISHV